MNTAQKLLLPPELVTEVALGIEPATTLFKRYGYSDAEYQQISTSTWFSKEIVAKRAALEADGFNFPAKMKMLAEDLMTEAYLHAKESDSVSAKLEVGKYLAKLADLEPRANAQAVSGPGFQINISIPSMQNEQVTSVIDIGAAPADEPEDAGGLDENGTFRMGLASPGTPETDDPRLTGNARQSELAGRVKSETSDGDG